MKNMLKLLLKPIWVLLGLVALLLLLFVLLVGLNNWGTKLFLDTVLARYNFQYRTLEGSLMTHMTLEDVSLELSSAKLTAQHAEIDVSFSDLIYRQIFVRTLALDGVHYQDTSESRSLLDFLKHDKKNPSLDESKIRAWLNRLSASSPSFELPQLPLGFYPYVQNLKVTNVSLNEQILDLNIRAQDVILDVNGQQIAGVVTASADITATQGLCDVSSCRWVANLQLGMQEQYADIKMAIDLLPLSAYTQRQEDLYHNNGNTEQSGLMSPRFDMLSSSKLHLVSSALLDLQSNDFMQLVYRLNTTVDQQSHKKIRRIVDISGEAGQFSGRLNGLDLSSLNDRLPSTHLVMSGDFSEDQKDLGRYYIRINSEKGMTWSGYPMTWRSELVLSSYEPFLKINAHLKQMSPKQNELSFDFLKQGFRSKAHLNIHMLQVSSLAPQFKGQLTSDVRLTPLTNTAHGLEFKGRYRPAPQKVFDAKSHLKIDYIASSDRLDFQLQDLAVYGPSWSLEQIKPFRSSWSFQETDWLFDLTSMAYRLKLNQQDVMTFNLKDVQFSPDNAHARLDVTQLNISDALVYEVGQLLGVMVDPHLKNNTQKSIKLRGDVVFNLNPLSLKAHFKRQGKGMWPLSVPVKMDFDQADVRLVQTGDLIDATIKADGGKSLVDGTLRIDRMTPLKIQKLKFYMMLPSKAYIDLDAMVTPNEQGQYMVETATKGHQWPLGDLTLGVLKKTKLGGNASISAVWDHQHGISQFKVKSQIEKGSMWFDRPLTGYVNLDLAKDVNHVAQTDDAYRLSDFYVLHQSDVSFFVGKHYAKMSGTLFDKNQPLLLDVDMPDFRVLWPSLTGGVVAHGQARADDQNTKFEFKGYYQLPRLDTAPAEQPVNFDVAWKGHFLTGQSNYEWTGQLEHLDITYRGANINHHKPVDIYVSDGVKNRPILRVGDMLFDVKTSATQKTQVHHIRTELYANSFSTVGKIDNLNINNQLIQDLYHVLNIQAEEEKVKTIVHSDKVQQNTQMNFNAQWDIQSHNGLSGRIDLSEENGVLVVPVRQTRKEIAFERMNASIVLEALNKNKSNIKWQGVVQSKDKGTINISGDTLLEQGKLGDIPFNLQADLKDLAWFSPFLGDSMVIAGQASLDAKGTFLSDELLVSGLSGRITGQQFNFEMPESGLRLKSGDIDILIANNVLTVQNMTFPAKLIVPPKYPRAVTYLKKYGNKIQSGTVTGFYDLNTFKGRFEAAVDHYPVIQRSDRFALGTGTAIVDLDHLKVFLDVDVKADLAWIDLKTEDNVVGLSSDVKLMNREAYIKLRKMQKASEVQHRLLSADKVRGVFLDLNLDVGQHAYLQGFGINAPIEGELTITGEISRGLKGVGTIRVKDGKIDAYGQKLDISKGTLVFQGPLTDPILNVEAVRRGLDVEAGVRVVGPVSKAKVELISYPDVSESEKFSWLLLGRSPNSDNKSDIALLLSLGSAWIGDGEPLYKKVGIDDISIQPGVVGKGVSILPRQTVASGSVAVDDIASQILSLSKRFGESVTLGLEQSLSEFGTVVKLAYNVNKNWNINLKLGTSNSFGVFFKKSFQK